MHKIDLGLLARRGLKAHHGLGRGAERVNILPQLRVAARIARRAALGEEARRLQLGKLGKPGLDQRVIRRELAGRTGRGP